MDPERWHHVQEICHAAAARHGADRAAFLDQACGDDAELRREVESLLDGASDDKGLLDTPAWEPARLEAGARVGPYEVLSLLGTGGMGEVYEARDTRLDRVVALKVLPADLTSDPERRTRFTREAKTIAQLNHPHICTLHDVGEAPVSDAAGAAATGPSRQYLVMERLKGETLAERLARSGRLPVDDALRIGAEVADALAAAHKHGVVHRDLKPANVMLTKAGAKLLDFGLAKLKGHGEQPAAAGLASMTTRSGPLTTEGTIVGTLQYMAPEQVEGKPADARSDLWALGAMLYEMLTGQRAFGGETAASLIAGILERAPAPIGELQPLTPPGLDRLVRKCLAKAPDDRWESAHDVADELRWIAQTGSVSDPTESLTEVPHSSPGTVWRQALTAIVAVLLTGVAVWLLWPEPERLVVRLTHNLPDGQGLRRAGRPTLALSRDGSQFVYNTKGGLFRRALADRQAQLIPGTEKDLANPFLSPDGTEVGFWDTEDQQLKRLPVNGGTPAVICAATIPYGVSWESDEMILFGQSDGIWRVSSAGGTPDLVIPAEPGKTPFGPHLLPDGDSVLFVEAAPDGWDEGRAVVASLRTGDRTPLGLVAREVRYLSTGHLVFAVAHSIFAVAFDLDGLRLQGDAVSLVQDVDNSSHNTGSSRFSLSETGTLIFMEGHSDARTLAWVDRNGNEKALGFAPDEYQYPRLSPDETRVAISLPGEAADILLLNLDRGILQALENSNSTERYALWTGDGDGLVFSSDRDGPTRLYAISADGAGGAEPLTEGKEGWEQYPQSLSPDGKWLIFLDWETATDQRDLRMVSLQGDRATEDLLVSAFSETNAELSPDGRWLAYESNCDGQDEVYLSPFPDVASAQEKVSGDGGFAPMWAHSGRELLYGASSYGIDHRIMSVSVDTDPDLRLGSPVKLFDVRESFFGSLRAFDISADDQRLLMVKSGRDPEPRLVIEVVINWFEELKAKVPAGR